MAPSPRARAMPELPEVETTARGIAPHITGRWIRRLAVHDRRLRWPVAANLARWAKDQQITAVRRRAKYIVMDLEKGWLLAHLGMSGSMLILPASTARETHDHYDMILDSGWTLRFNDPRRFGSLHHGKGDVGSHPLLRELGPEPLDRSFDADYLHYVTRGRRVAIKVAIMDSHLVVGVGNIYASEALFRAGIRPSRTANSLTHAECVALVDAIKAVLAMAIEHGGTTLRDFVGAGGEPGYFRQELAVYERKGEPCRQCGKQVRHLVQGQRSTYYCGNCQR
jgi:formamidopyrimidine-DNA glycosylase